MTTHHVTLQSPVTHLPAVTPAPTYRGKHPDRIRALSTAVKEEGQKFADILIETNCGARFRFELLHRHAPMPSIGQEIEFWLYYIIPTNPQGFETFQRNAVDF